MARNFALATQASAPTAKLQGLHVLVVDDNEDARELIAIALESHGAQVTQADSVAAAMSVATSERLDVLVSDIGMPLEDGYGLMRRLRALDSKARQMPAVAVTAFGAHEDRLKALAAGFQEHMPKPFDAQSLVDVVARLAESSTTVGG